MKKYKINASTNYILSKAFTVPWRMRAGRRLLPRAIPDSSQIKK